MDDARMKSTLDAVLQRAVDEGIPGVVGAITTARGTIYEGAFGSRSLGGAEPMTPDTVFRIASMTKAIVGFAVMQLVERGRLDLDAPAGQLVPYLGEVQVIDGFGPSGEPVLRPPATPVTLRHLLTHTSGFAYDLWSPVLRRWADATGFAGRGREGRRTPLVFDPGAGWQYGIGYDWAAIVLEAAAGQGLEAYARENIFAPLGMEASWTVRGERRSRMARHHVRGASGSLTVDPGDPPETLPFEDGGGGIHTTGPDYLRFIRMILNGGAGDGTRLMREETLRQLLRADAAPGNAVTPLVSTNLAKSNPGEFFPGVRKRHSLGFMVNDELAPTGRSPGSAAWAGFCNTYYWIDPVKGIGGVFMTQIEPFLDHHALRAFGEFETAAYAAHA
jgi:methyl acetate hydrolase